MYDLFRCTSPDVTVNSVSLVGGNSPGLDSFDPAPVYGRGLWYDGTAYSHFENLNMGQDFTFSIWFNANDFRTLYSIADADKGTTFEIREGFAGQDNQAVTEIYVQTLKGHEHAIPSGF